MVGREYSMHIYNGIPIVLVKIVTSIPIILDNYRART